MTLPVATLASLWVSSTFLGLVGICRMPLTMAPSPTPLQGVPVILPTLVCLGCGDAGGLWGCPQASGQGHADGHLPCTDGGLYTATRYEFRSLPDIRRNLHQRPLKTEESPLHWLNGEMSPFFPSRGPWDTVHCTGELEQVWGMALEFCVVCYEKELRQGGIPHSVLVSNHHFLLCVPRC